MMDVIETSPQTKNPRNRGLDVSGGLTYVACADDAERILPTFDGQFNPAPIRRHDTRSHGAEARPHVRKVLDPSLGAYIQARG
jgi:hypothetical protein